MLFTPLSIRFLIEKAPISYYLYAIFPCYFWSALASDVQPFSKLFASIRHRSFFRSFIYAVLVGTTLLFMVQGYSYRPVFSAIILGMGIIWPLLGMEGAFREESKGLVAAWSGACGVLAIFPALPVEKGESLPVMYVPRFHSLSSISD